jgi:hypothetical protein
MAFNSKAAIKRQLPARSLEHAFIDKASPGDELVLSNQKTGARNIIRVEL